MSRAVMDRIGSVAALDTLRRSLAPSLAAAPRVRVCIGTGCAARGSQEVYDLFRKAAKKAAASGGKAVSVEAKCVGCHGLCERGPIVVVDPGNILYQRVAASDVEEIFTTTVLGGAALDRLLYEDPATGRKIRTVDEIPFYKAQKRIVLAENGRIDPTRIDDYIAAGGYAALAKALTSMTPESVIDEVEKSGLRGRGGGGYPAARKWRACRAAAGDRRFVICNGDEGDPGAFMDRSTMEGNPHSVIEGMIIGAYAIGAREGYLYVRAEYPMAVAHLTLAIGQAVERGLLGAGILGTDFSFDLHISRGGGAFVCGESTALMASIEGRLGEPRAKHVHASESGLWDSPTVLNNVETWATIPPIVTNGGEWLAGIGTPGSKGTKIFSLVGKINNTGLLEVPMGISLKEIVTVIGGGIPGGKKLKAVQTGGPSGGCIPADRLDVPVDFDELARLGSMMGSGGMIVMDEGTCMVDMARYFVNFLIDESCGKCTPCREGLQQMLRILLDITHGRAAAGALEELEEIAEVVRDASLCGLGTTAPTPVLSMLRYFRPEYEAHIAEKKCPAGVCKALISYRIDAEACTGCMLCLKRCPVHAITGERKKPHVIDAQACIKCGACDEVCKFDAVVVE
jgi:NADH:ubiquinone oxidoreductase subunit F (NADH-binding)/(2Fe-2S) ferredoxin/Pyruvate/2-oxoacid:ferredoxin oxidoreductase delta subunit